MHSATERRAILHSHIASAMRRAFVAGALAASLWPTPVAAVDVIPQEFAGQSFEERLRNLIDVVEEPFSEGRVDYARLPRIGVGTRSLDELLTADPGADTHYQITVDGHTFELTVPGARRGAGLVGPRRRPRSKARWETDPAVVEDLLNAAMHVSAGAPDVAAPLPEGGGLVMLTSGVAAVALMRRRRRLARADRSEAHAGERMTAVDDREGEPTRGPELDHGVPSGLLA